MPPPKIDTIVLSNTTWISCRLSEIGRWTESLAEAQHLQQLYAGVIPPGAAVLRENVTPESGIELLASPMRASQRDESQPVIRMKRCKDGYVRMGPLRKKKRRRQQYPPS